MTHLMLWLLYTLFLAEHLNNDKTRPFYFDIIIK